jgi:hypothetical protein
MTAKNHITDIYENMEFPAYQFREFPKQIKLGKSGRIMTAQNASHELQLQTEDADSDLPEPAHVTERNALAQSVADERARNAELEAELAALRAQVNDGPSASISDNPKVAATQAAGEGAKQVDNSQPGKSTPAKA